LISRGAKNRCAGAFSFFDISEFSAGLGGNMLVVSWHNPSSARQHPANANILFM
jgi:hypothetical protein